MCDWEEFIFGCSCSYTKRKNYCHFARNDPNHQCFGVQVLKKVWDVPEVCDKCSQKSNRTSTRSYQHHGQDPSESTPARSLSFSLSLFPSFSLCFSVGVGGGGLDYRGQRW